MTTSRGRAALLLGVQLAAAYVLLVCVALTVPRGDHPTGVLVSLGALAVLVLPVVVGLALLLSAALLQLALGLLDVALPFARAVEVMLWAALPLAVRNVLLGGAALAVGGQQAAALVRFGDPFVLAAAVVVVVRLRACGVGRGRAATTALFVVGLPLVLQLVLGSGAV